VLFAPTRVVLVLGYSCCFFAVLRIPWRTLLSCAPMSYVARDIGGFAVMQPEKRMTHI
jgi:hypothetical protein